MKRIFPVIISTAFLISSCAANSGTTQLSTNTPENAAVTENTSGIISGDNITTTESPEEASEIMTGGFVLTAPNAGQNPSSVESAGQISPEEAAKLAGITAVDATITTTGGSFEIYNNGGQPLRYDHAYKIAKVTEEGQYEELEQLSDVPMTLNFLYVGVGEIERLDISWGERYGELPDGDYVLLKQLEFGETAFSGEAKFTVSENGEVRPSLYYNNRIFTPADSEFTFWPNDKILSSLPDGYISAGMIESYVPSDSKLPTAELTTNLDTIVGHEIFAKRTEPRVIFIATDAGYALWVSSADGILPEPQFEVLDSAVVVNASEDATASVFDWSLNDSSAKMLIANDTGDTLSVNNAKIQINLSGQWHDIAMADDGGYGNLDSYLRLDEYDKQIASTSPDKYQSLTDFDVPAGGSRQYWINWSAHCGHLPIGHYRLVVNAEAGGESLTMLAEFEIGGLPREDVFKFNSSTETDPERIELINLYYDKNGTLMRKTLTERDDIEKVTLALNKLLIVGDVAVDDHAKYGNNGVKIEIITKESTRQIISLYSNILAFAEDRFFITEGVTSLQLIDQFSAVPEPAPSEDFLTESSYPGDR